MTMQTTQAIPTTRPATGDATRSVSASRGNTFVIYLVHLLARSRRSTLIWAISLAAYGALIVSVFPSVQGTMDISTYPDAMLEAFDITTMDQIEPYLTGQVLSYLPLVVSFIPIMMFSGALAGAEERGSLDVLLGTPLPRRHLVLTTALTAAVNLALVLLALAAANWLTSLAVDAGLALGDSLAGSLAAWPAGMALGGIALVLSASLHQRGKVTGFAIGAMFGMYALYVVSKLVDSLDWLKWLSVFHYYGNAIEDGVYWIGFAVLSAFAIAMVALAVRLFERRDIYA
jgi:ABC-2 type transport system permease protein